MTASGVPVSRQAKHPILVLEASNEWREILSFPLIEQGYAVQGCSTVGAAWKFASGHPTALIIFGERLNGLDGISSMAVLKERFPGLRCVAVVEDMEAWSKRAPTWLDAAVFKPLDLDQLVQVMETLSGQRIGRHRILDVWGSVKRSLLRGWNWGKHLWLHWRLRRVEHWRRRCFSEFYRQVHSGAIGTGGAIQAWDELENLDQACAPAAQGQINCKALSDGFRLLCDFIATQAKTRCFWSDKRDPHAVSCQELTRLMQRIRADVITVEQLRAAPYLRRCAARRGQEDANYLAVWGEDAGAATPWAGARATLDRKLVALAWSRGKR